MPLWRGCIMETLHYGEVAVQHLYRRSPAIGERGCRSPTGSPHTRFSLLSIRTPTRGVASQRLYAPAGNTIEHRSDDSSGDGMVARRAAPGMDAIAQDDDDRAVLRDDHQRRSGEASMPETPWWRRTHKVRSVDHPSQSARLRQPRCVIRCCQCHRLWSQKCSSSTVVGRGQPGAAKHPEIAGSAEESSVPGDTAKRIRAFIVDCAMDQASAPLMVEFGWCDARQ